MQFTRPIRCTPSGIPIQPKNPFQDAYEKSIKTVGQHKFADSTIRNVEKGIIYGTGTIGTISAVKCWVSPFSSEALNLLLLFNGTAISFSATAYMGYLFCRKQYINKQSQSGQYPGQHQ